MAGSLAGYLIGAWGGRPLLDRYGRYVHIHPDDLDRADAWFARYGSWAVFLARMVPLLRALINYPAGVARMPLGRFLLFSTLGLAAMERRPASWRATCWARTTRPCTRPSARIELVIYAVVILGGAYVIYRWARGRGSPRTETSAEGEPDAG